MNKNKYILTICTSPKIKIGWKYAEYENLQLMLERRWYGRKEEVVLKGKYFLSEAESTEMKHASSSN